MAVINVDDLNIVRVGDLGQEEGYFDGTQAGRQGKVVFQDATDGDFGLATSASLAGWGAEEDVRGSIVGVISTKPRSNLSRESCTVLRDADVWLGYQGDNTLKTLPIGAPVFLGTGGLLDTEAGATNVQIGHVVLTRYWSGSDKLLRINTVPLATVPVATAPVGGG